MVESNISQSSFRNYSQGSRNEVPRYFSQVKNAIWQKYVWFSTIRASETIDMRIQLIRHYKSELYFGV